MERIREVWEKLDRFLKEVRSELKKVTWPQKKEIIGSTVVVIISVFIVAFFLGLVDVTLQRMLSYLIR
ncbi:MAG: preprotein translocase subunit SecE [candidate division NC10 bacterium]|nr:preprotein translocase subunit SecE [candidate division NC10 bacterium]